VKTAAILIKQVRGVDLVVKEEDYLLIDILRICLKDVLICF
jgi:hypothetical protein